MPKDNSTAVTDIKVQQERTHFQYMLAKNPNYFGNIPGSDLKPNMKLIAEASYEQLTCVGYNPDTGNMEATFSVKQSAGYAGDLCSAGSLEYIRFYMDLHDGHGFIDQGSVAINVHDIPQGKDCKGNLDFPILYVGTLMKKSSSFFYCEKPVLPTLRAILSWSFDPPVNSPNWQPVWGSVLDGDIQLKPSPKIFLKANEALLATHLNIAAVSPHLSNDQITEITGVNTAQLNTIPEAVSLADLIKESEKSKVPATRFAFKSIANMIKFPSSEITLQDKATLSAAKIDISKIIDQIALPVPHDTSKQMLILRNWNA